MPIKRDDVIKRISKDGNNNNDNNNNNNNVEEQFEFLNKRILEMAERLEHLVDVEDVERMSFVMALFGKYMQYYSTQNDYLVDKEVVKVAIYSTNAELTKGFDEQPITEFEEEMIVAYLERIQSKMYELSDEERKKLR